MLYFADPSRENKFLEKEINQAVSKVIHSGSYILGPEVSSFEEEFSNYLGLGSGYSAGCATGTDAIMLSLAALGISCGDEVITPSHTAGGTITAIQLLGAKPVFCDIEEDYYCIDPNLIENLVTDKTKAIIAVHIYGGVCDLTKILDICKKKKLFLVEDCAQSFGSKYNNLHVGTFGDIAAFSFYPTKNLGCLGDGGLVFSKNLDLINTVKQIRQYGWKNRYFSERLGWNSRLDELQAAILRIKLKNYILFKDSRTNAADFYLKELYGIDNLILPKTRGNSEHSWHIFAVRSKSRDLIISNLKEQNIFCGVHYPIPCHLQPGHCREMLKLPITEKVSNQQISLPIFSLINTEDLNKVIRTIR